MVSCGELGSREEEEEEEEKRRREVSEVDRGNLANDERRCAPIHE